ncbi:MAG TPA: LuxR C-terminal-related transcriptional regulator [Flavisolibacter sp.]|nr:LuxR C-terminal-related transcriptional regulator [Flavisolibacter sp.]
MNNTLTDMVFVGKATLTRRETELLYLMSQGKSNKEIAAHLHISVQTVQKHFKNIYRKVGAHNKIEALNKTRLLITSLYQHRN